MIDRYLKTFLLKNRLDQSTIVDDISLTLRELDLNLLLTGSARSPITAVCRLVRYNSSLKLF
jgi:uroporphyrinogen-III decarboxylase